MRCYLSSNSHETFASRHRSASWHVDSISLNNDTQTQWSQQPMLPDGTEASDLTLSHVTSKFEYKALHCIIDRMTVSWYFVIFYVKCPKSCRKRWKGSRCIIVFLHKTCVSNTQDVLCCCVVSWIEEIQVKLHVSVSLEASAAAACRDQLAWC